MMQPQLMSQQQDHANTFSFHKHGAPTPLNFEASGFLTTKTHHKEYRHWSNNMAGFACKYDVYYLKIAELVT